MLTRFLPIRSVSYSDFVNKELVLFSNLDNERSIPSLVDGFKPGQRKVASFVLMHIHYCTFLQENIYPTFVFF